MQKFKSKAPDLIGFQWVEGVNLKDKLQINLLQI